MRETPYEHLKDEIKPEDIKDDEERRLIFCKPFKKHQLDKWSKEEVEDESERP